MVCCGVWHVSEVSYNRLCTLLYACLFAYLSLLVSLNLLGRAESTAK